MIILTKICQHLILFASSQIRDIRRHQRVLPRQQLGRPGRLHHGGGEQGRVGVGLPVVAALAGRRLPQQRPQPLEVHTEQRVVGEGRRWVDQAAQVRRVAEQLVQPRQPAAQVGIAPGQLQPLLQLPLDRDAGAGDGGNRKLPIAAALPGRQGQVEAGDLGAARVQLQHVDVVADDGVARFPGAQPFFLHPHPHEHLERGHDEVARPAAGVDHRHLGHRLRPAVEGARRGGSVLLKAQIVERPVQRAVGPARRPPRPQGVLQQEAHHVVFGEQLRHRGDVGPADLALAGVDRLLAGALPELVAPAQAVVAGEDRRRQLAHNPLQPVPPLGGQAHLQRGVPGAKDARQHGRGVAGGHRPQVLGSLLLKGPFLLGQLGALGQGHGHARRVHQQVVLGQEAGKEHTVPLLVGDLLHQQGQARAHVALAQLARPRPQRPAQRPLRLAQAVEGLVALDGQGGQGGAGGGFGLGPGPDDGFLEGGANLG